MRDFAQGSDNADLRVRAAWLYYMEGLTQEQVAARLGISRIRVLRLLAASREDGTVQIRINARSTRQVALARRLEQAFGLDEAVVVPAPEDEAQLSTLIGHAVGAYLSDEIRDGQAVGIGWGATLQKALLSVSRRPVAGVKIVSLLGGLTHSTGVNPSAVAWRLADLYEAECYQITAPVFASDETMRAGLWQHPELRQVRERAPALDLAFVSVGSVTADDTIFRLGLLSPEDARSLAEAGAVGDVLCHFVDAAGRVVDHPINRRVMAIPPAELRAVPKVVLAAGGRRKLAAIRAALAATGARVLVTDEGTAEALSAGAAHALGERRLA